VLLWTVLPLCGPQLLALLEVWRSSCSSAAVARPSLMLSLVFRSLLPSLAHVAALSHAITASTFIWALLACSYKNRLVSVHLWWHACAQGMIMIARSAQINSLLSDPFRRCPAGARKWICVVGLLDLTGLPLDGSSPCVAAVRIVKEQTSFWTHLQFLPVFCLG
jgi:hypothetical protein